MKNLINADAWKLTLNEFNPVDKRLAESLFSIGNGHMGQRGFFEEQYSGDSLQGTYIAGVYYPDKTKVGWWKNGYNESFAKVVNSINWIGVDIAVNGEQLDLAKTSCEKFRMELDMKTGLLSRSFTTASVDGKKTSFSFQRFLSMANHHIAVVEIAVSPLNYDGEIYFEPYLDGNVQNEDSNYGDKFWRETGFNVNDETFLLSEETLKTEFRISAAMSGFVDGIRGERTSFRRDGYVGLGIRIPVYAGKKYTLHKIISVCTSRNYDKSRLDDVTLANLRSAVEQGADALFQTHCAVMEKKWQVSDVIIDGDIKAQQGIRYNIFQLNGSYTGEDPRLNLGPKGFSGEKYGGSTYWDTEAFCLPFFLYTNAGIARNLLYYRYLHLEKARENAARLGLRGALYPMVTMDGEECHNEWEITFEELHRNGAIAYAIYNYTNYTGDRSYLEDYGIEEIVEISRFYASRVTYQPRKDQYMLLNVTGPNEYENNINNNWYTNHIATWTMEFTLSSLDELKADKPGRYKDLCEKLCLTATETEKWHQIIEKMYYPYIKESNLFEQQDQYMDKEQMLVKDIPPEELPLNKHWSWDRILRSCFIKQADVIQLFYFFPDKYDVDTIRCNFDFYEPRTVHESSLSPSVYSIIASKISYKEKAYELYLRTARLDLDNYNDDTEDGIHLTSMTGSWLAIVQGFAGVLVKNGRLTMSPRIPVCWNGYCFRIDFRGSRLQIRITTDNIKINLIEGIPLEIVIDEVPYTVSGQLNLSLLQKEAVDA